MTPGAPRAAVLEKSGDGSKVREVVKIAGLDGVVSEMAGFVSNFCGQVADVSRQTAIAHSNVDGNGSGGGIQQVQPKVWSPPPTSSLAALQQGAASSAGGGAAVVLAARGHSTPVQTLSNQVAQQPEITATLGFASPAAAASAGAAGTTLSSPLLQSRRSAALVHAAAAASAAAAAAAALTAYGEEEDGGVDFYPLLGNPPLSAYQSAQGLQRLQ